MNALDLAQKAYSNTAAPTRTLRGSEYDAFARITRKLIAAAQATTNRMGLLATAIHENRRLWAILAGDVAEAGNGLPADLRARIFYLYEFTQQHGSKVLRGEANPVILVEINRAVMQGLRDSAAEK